VLHFASDVKKLTESISLYLSGSYDEVTQK